MGKAGVLQGLMMPEREPDDSPPSNVRLRMSESMPTLCVHAPSQHVHSPQIPKEKSLLM